MADWPVGLSTGCFYRTDIFEVLGDIRDGGFSMLEICSYPAHLDYHDYDKVEKASDRIDEMGLEVFSFHAPFADHIDITSPDGRQYDNSVNEMFEAAEAAARMETKNFIIHPGPEKEGRPPAAERIDRLHRVVDALNRVADFCNNRGMNLVLENMLPHLLFGATSDLLWIMGALEKIDERNVGICLDTGHAHLTGDLYTVMYKLSGHLKVIHASDNRGGRDDHLPPGEGDIDWSELLRRLDRTGFDGSFILELAADDSKSRADLLRGARHSRKLIRSTREWRR